MHRTQLAHVIPVVADAVESGYVFPEVGKRLAASLRSGAQVDRYATVTDPGHLADLVTQDLHAATNDLHLRLLHHPEHDPDQHTAPEEAEWVEQARVAWGGIESVRRLDDNVAHIVIGPVLSHPAHGGDAVASAMSLVADADALVLDLRGCRGGCPEGVALVCSHLFGPEPVHLIDVESREDGVHQSWTQAHVAGRRLGPTRPVAVLTSAETFSGGEELAFDLQELGRAVVVGERTRGGAHPRVAVPIHPTLELTLPVARAISPRTGTNWEGVGVEPDVDVPAREALDAAHNRLVALSP